ncbi:MAG TPA: peptidoglycan bridge formation glycyltransferase FemA/FemB family protein [Acidobacteriaceae bacterium]|jgi:lipid II:glycine glycyltransferase (peptidoglycan interpeptide bridge formation enzyme)|nr:peptidoglycan bridge formation glycyltransferase FemA/FemB family protein [Acidobacteriaceae bacterium]
MTTSWHVEVDQATPHEWSQILDLFDDANIYQTAAYGDVRWGNSNLSRLVLKRDGEIAGAAQLRIVRPTPLRFGMAYLRWGPLWERRCRPLDPEVPAVLARTIEDEYVTKRKLFVRILPNAFAGSPRAEVFQSAFAKFTREIQEPSDLYRTFVVDLAAPLDELRSKLDAKWRNKLKQAEKNHLTVISGSGNEEYRRFCAMYSEMRKRKTFDTTVDVAEFGRMQEQLSESQRMHVLLCLDKDIPVAGIVASAMGDSAIYLLGATSDAGLNAKGAYLLQWTLMGWLRERGTRWYDLGGIDPEGNPGVYYFKRGFSGADVFQIEPRAACESAVSSGMVKAGVTLQRTLSSASKLLNRNRELKQVTAQT